jgi:hypothetical protein
VSNRLPTPFEINREQRRLAEEKREREAAEERRRTEAAADDVQAIAAVVDAVATGDLSHVETEVAGHPLAQIVERVLRLAVAGVKPLIDLDDWRMILKCSRRQVEKMRANGSLPPPDMGVGKRPLWHARTVNEFLTSPAKRKSVRA